MLTNKIKNIVNKYIIENLTIDITKNTEPAPNMVVCMGKM